MVKTWRELIKTLGKVDKIWRELIKTWGKVDQILRELIKAWGCKKLVGGDGGVGIQSN